MQGLGQGDTLSDSFVVTVTDEDGLTDTVTVNITITGTGDAPVITAGNDSGAVAEDGDAGCHRQSRTRPTLMWRHPTWSAAGRRATAPRRSTRRPASGPTRSTTALTAVQGLGQGDTLSDSFVVTVTDEDGLTDTVTVTITITGTGDAPVITAGNDTGAVAEDGTLVATGNLELHRC